MINNQLLDAFSTDVGSRYLLRGMNALNLLTSCSKTNLFKNSFMNKKLWEWNRLPHAIEGGPSVTNFNFSIFVFSVDF